MALFLEKGRPPHFSTIRAKERARRQGDLAYYCQLCNQWHQTEGANESRILLSDSTLYGVCGTGKAATTHVEAEVVNGAKIEDLKDILEEKYLKPDPNPRPTKVILIAGINNITARQSAAQILDGIAEMRQVLVKHHKESNLTIATLPLPPKVCSLAVTRNQKGTFYNLPSHLNKVEEIEATNVGIQAMNRAWSAEGIDIAKIGNQGEGIGRQRKTRHIDERHWRKPGYFIEDGINKGKLHFAYPIRRGILQQALQILDGK